MQDEWDGDSACFVTVVSLRGRKRRSSAAREILVKNCGYVSNAVSSALCVSPSCLCCLTSVGLVCCQPYVQTSDGELRQTGRCFWSGEAVEARGHHGDPALFLEEHKAAVVVVIKPDLCTEKLATKKMDDDA